MPCSPRRPFAPSPPPAPMCNRPPLIMFADKEEVKNTTDCLRLRWALGFNYEIMDGMHNLTNQHRKELFYAVGNTGVIYNYSNQSQRLLQGHCNSITCTAYNREKDILVTADSGEESMLVVWDAFKGIPLKTIFYPHPDGVCTLDVSLDGNYIVTVSKDVTPEEFRAGKRQQVSLWDWQNQDDAVVSVEIKQPQLSEKEARQSDIHMRMLSVRFNPSVEVEFATTGPKYVIFWNWVPGTKGLDFYALQNDKDNQEFTQTVFIPSSTEAVTGTNNGTIIVWNVSYISDDIDQPNQRKHMKKVHLMNNSGKSERRNKNKEKQLEKEKGKGKGKSKGKSKGKGQFSGYIPGQSKSPGRSKSKSKKDKHFSSGKEQNPAINILRIEGDHLVIGSSNGSIRFYDFQYRIKAWFQDIDIDSITTVSFSSWDFKQDDKEARKDEQIFSCPDFLVVDKSARVTLLTAAHFEKIEREEKKGDILMQSIVSAIVASAVRPTSSTLVISCRNSKIYSWNFEDKRSVIQEETIFNLQSEEVNIPTCLNYSPNGKYLSVATSKGMIKILEIDKNDITQLYVAETDKSHPCVTMQVFSSDSRHLATMDNEHSVALFILQERWQIAGKIRVHHDTIRSIAFGQFLDDKGEPKLRLFSISNDMKMGEYEVVQNRKGEDDSANKYNRLKLKSIFPIEQECHPTACIWYPINLYKQNVLLVVNQQYKLKLWNMLKDNLKICKRTCLGPTYGGEITKLLILNPNDEKNIYQEIYLAYATREKVVGIIKLPLDGNPNNTLGLIAHPTDITSISSTVDGKLFFTSGSTDYCVNIWEVNIPALEQNFTVPAGHNPFPDLLEGGPDGALRDLKDFFYYSQIRSKDQHSTKARKLDGKVPLQAIPNMMRSMGYYPTNKEIQNMQNEIKFSKILESYGDPTTELDLDAFLRLFVNHRPVWGIGMAQIQTALQTLSKGKNSIGRSELFEALMTEGEKMTQEELDEAELILMGEGNHFPEQIDVDTLSHKILGFDDVDKEETPESDSFK